MLVEELVPAMPYGRDSGGYDTYLAGPDGRLVALLHDKSLSRRRVTMGDTLGQALMTMKNHSLILKRSGDAWVQASPSTTG